MQGAPRNSSRGRLWVCWAVRAMSGLTVTPRLGTYRFSNSTSRFSRGHPAPAARPALRQQADWRSTGPACWIDAWRLANGARQGPWLLRPGAGNGCALDRTVGAARKHEPVGSVQLRARVAPTRDHVGASARPLAYQGMHTTGLTRRHRPRSYRRTRPCERSRVYDMRQTITELEMGTIFWDPTNGERHSGLDRCTQV